MARTAISRDSLETHDNGKKKWSSPQLSARSHTLSGMIVHLGLFSGIRLLEEEVTIFLAQQTIILTASEITTSQGLRPGGEAWDQVGWPSTWSINNVFSWNSLALWTRYHFRTRVTKRNGNFGTQSSRTWDMFAPLSYELSECTEREPLKLLIDQLDGWSKGSLKLIQFLERLHLFGVTNSKARDKIWAHTAAKKYGTIRHHSQASRFHSVQFWMLFQRI